MRRIGARHKVAKGAAQSTHCRILCLMKLVLAKAGCERWDGMRVFTAEVEYYH